MKGKGKDKRGRKQKSNPKNQKAQAKKPKKGVQPGKVFLYALGVAAAGGGAYLVYDRMKTKTIYRGAQQDPSDTIIINNNLPATVNPTSLKSSVARSTAFPLKRGSKGIQVSQLQQALANIIGLSAMNANGGIDGQFGPGTANALKIAGYPEVIDQATFNKIIGSTEVKESSSFNASNLALKLYRAAQSKIPDTVISLLQQLKSVSDYSSVNEHYKKQGFISKTIVTDLLDYAFAGNESVKKQIRNEFLRMGLKMNESGRWSLQGIRLYKDLLTLRETFVTDAKGIRIAVRKNTILGDEVRVANGMTWFKSIDNSILSVPTQDVKYT